jgi:hypothetical protein
VPASEDASGADDDGVELVLLRVGVDQMLRAKLGDGVEIMPADGVALADDAAADFGPVVDAEGAYINDAPELAQPRMLLVAPV